MRNGRISYSDLEHKIIFLRISIFLDLRAFNNEDFYDIVYKLLRN